MHHLAILARRWRLLEKILSGEKTIESRWYKSRRAPYGKIKAGDVVYFKESGGPVTARAVVERVLFFGNLDSRKISHILEKYGKRICISKEYAGQLAGKRFCTLVFLKGAQRVKPFSVDKKGFGMMAAWISVDSIERIKSG